MNGHRLEEDTTGDKRFTGLVFITEYLIIIHATETSIDPIKLLC